MLFIRKEMDFFALLDALQTKNGLIELALGFMCVLAAYALARRLYGHWFAEHPERYDRFLPYTGFRLVLPVSAQVLVVLVSLAWGRLEHAPMLVLHILSALLFWLAVIRLCTAVVRQAFPHSRFERHSEHFLATVLWLGFVSWTIGFDVAVMDWLESISFSIGKTKLDLLTIINGLLWVTVIVVVALWASRVIEARIMKLKHLDSNLRIVFAKLTRTALVVVAVLIALPVVGIDLTVLSVFGGAVGIGLGFGLQKIASNFVSGFIILLDRSIRIGDRLMVDNRIGYVTKMTSRYVVLKAADGTEALIPNDALMSNTVINQSYSDKNMWTSLPVQVAYGTDLELAIELLKQAADHPRVLKDPGANAFVTLFADSGINMELGFWVADPENGFMGLKSDINLAIWRLFKQHNIDIPFPQREVRIIGDKPAQG
ncbi:mechanosensitive ion channel protein MscS [Chromobacterium phragmitis]|uniref:Mechanosensitive ion channel domain-containing protein n=1 Tax=Chromobacterium phragmitis TaxID=2202141 RepID=A0A344UEG0_9NEIS|nr:mechanosensitive ion channel domain-containing protein [Chromobacterium phragmitis]AXE32318.1 mechanosensitive ion channel protein MscS [Chromobacterium phragmitis]AXE33658.1 mechanosensitive ion channel protein MscS [Chromobacterium phragmitis]